MKSLLRINPDWRTRKIIRRRGLFFFSGFAEAAASFFVIFFLSLRLFKEPRMTGNVMYNMGIDLMGAAVCCLLFFGAVGRDTEDESAFNFGPMILINCFSFLLNAVEWFCTGVPELRKLFLIAKVLDDILDGLLIYHFWRYIQITLAMKNGRIDRMVRTLLIPHILVILINLFVPALLWIDAEGVFHPTNLYWISDLYLILFMVITVIQIARANVGLRQKFVVVFFASAPFLHYLVTLNKNGYATREGAILVSILLVYEILFEDRSERLTAAKKELGMAAGIQQAMLPRAEDRDGTDKRYLLDASMEPAREVGGDFYDYFPVDDNHLALLIADVSDKGVPAGLFMMSAKILINYRTRQGGSPAEILTQVNEEICKNNPGDMFVTVWLGILDLSTGEMICANAGHEYPAIRGEDGAFHIFQDRHGFVLGGMSETKYRNYTLNLKPGDAIFVYTDGVTEANNPEKQLYGLEHLTASLNAAAKQSPKEILARVRADVNDFAAGAEQSDDLTMLCLEYLKDTSYEDNIAQKA